LKHAKGRSINKKLIPFSYPYPSETIFQPQSNNFPFSSRAIIYLEIDNFRQKKKAEKTLI